MFHSMILAGGSGTRLWPLSRTGAPKFLHALTGTDLSLLQATAARLAELAPAERSYVVTGVAHVAAVSRQLAAIPAGNILVEPAPRDSCAAIGLAAAVIAGRDPEAVVGVFSADHLIGDQARFAEVVRRAAAAADEGYLATVGIRPTRPETGFGYLRTGGRSPGGCDLVAEFKEKPSREVAEAYLDSGEYLWNAGMFVFQARIFLDRLAEHRPELHAGVTRIAAARDTPDADAVLAEAWPELEKISVDYAVLEPAAAAGAVATVPADFPWSDIGDFNSLGESLAGDEDGNLVLGGRDRAVLVDVKSSVIATSGRVVAIVGVQDLVVAETADAVLVCPRSRAQEVKQIVETLRARGLDAHI